MSGSSMKLDPGSPQAPEIRSAKLLWTLASAGALAGALIVIAHQMTAPTIEAYKARKLQEAVREVLGGPERWEVLYVVDDSLTPTPPPGVPERSLETVFLGYREDGTAIGFAVSGAEPGFQDTVELLFGYDPRTKRVLGMKVLASKETPGLGDKIVSDPSFVAEFQGVVAPLVGVQSGRATGADNEVDVITGATISSRTVIRIINDRLERLGSMLDAYFDETD